MAFDQKQYDLFKALIEEWHPWEEKFAWLPCIASGKVIWLRSYYERCKMFMPESRVERALTIFDVLKS